MRFFIALEIPEENTRQIASVQQKIKQILPDIRLTDPTKLHLTLAFIGEQSDDLKTELEKVIAQAVNEIPPFEVTPCCLDGFPHLHSAHILWLGVSGEIDKLLLIRHRIKDGLINLSLDVDERRFIPHIAIGKLRNSKVTLEQEAMLNDLMEDNFDPIGVDSIKLFESIPNHGLHDHNTLAEIKLTGK